MRQEPLVVNRTTNTEHEYKFGKNMYNMVLMTSRLE